ncbi:MAG: transcriptional regulator [Mesorhizobium sp.]
MQRKSEKQIVRQQTESLASLYRAIGPAAITAALICAKKKPSKVPVHIPRSA